jgi:hypothetical protein
VEIFTTGTGKITKCMGVEHITIRFKIAFTREILKKEKYVEEVFFSIAILKTTIWARSQRLSIMERDCFTNSKMILGN